MSLPRYETAKDHYQAGISALAPYLDIETLRAMVQANRRFFHIFSSCLWEDPVKYLLLSDTHSPFERFVALLLRPPFQKNNVFVKSLDVRPILQEAFKRQHERDYWKNEPDLNLETVLRFITKMPNLKYLILDGMPSVGDGTYRDTSPGSGLDMLVFSVASCFTVDVSLVLRQPRFHHLMYLDMSGTDTTQSSFWQLEHLDLQNLRVLKMRQLRLTTIPNFVLRCGPQLWSLDVRDNFLGDPQIRRLLDFCRQPDLPGVADPVSPDDDAAMYESPPVYQKHDHGPWSTLSTRRPDSASAVIRHMEEHAQSENSSMYIQSGLTNLYVSGNRLTSEILVDLLSTRNRLQVLDIGTVRAANKNKTKNHTTDLFPAAPPHASVWWSPPSPIRPSAQPSPIQDLRIHHSWATYTPTISSSSSSTDTFHLPHLHDAEVFGSAYTSALDAAAADPLAAATYHLTSLTLTGIPTKSHGFTIEQLIRLLRHAAAQAERLARARSAQASAQAPAGTLLSGLRLLRLEFVRTDTGQEEEEEQEEKEDEEMDTFLASTRGDFSFFNNDDDDNNNNNDDDDDKGKGDKKAKGKEQTNMQTRARAKVKAKAKLPPADDLRDVVAELKAFRASASGEVPRWNGTLQLVVPLTASC
ncbi:Leucine Rich Repeat domain protein [Drepanopeziza brunnea f. sp. 'multigermtubi' MB_m1]|uniref:Leucine Rich Repeat domain protein n=1 Tax=Marssonina brunnea f. sp. multigermtubi (strain MB_m1) TaxID=1072389 RepID=K1WPH3_MARBU|nr:Leucine Rich Repeat domain protein [Drepanopeziza brunnea f. sp. 'multigermtubi' MB_m1]EKD19535.1 Leucine Rich Repeat domain protein [Drepanopeziza brunnea f. sp. 'multigermtubi' MB_m1]